MEPSVLLFGSRTPENLQELDLEALTKERENKEKYQQKLSLAEAFLAGNRKSLEKLYDDCLSDYLEAVPLVSLVRELAPCFVISPRFDIKGALLMDVMLSRNAILWVIQAEKSSQRVAQIACMHEASKTVANLSSKAYEEWLNDLGLKQFAMHSDPDKVDLLMRRNTLFWCDVFLAWFKEPGKDFGTTLVSLLA